MINILIIKQKKNKKWNMNKNITLNIIAFFFKLDFRFFEMYLLLIYFRLGPFDPLKYVTSIEKQVVLFFFI